jgi:cytochrome c5
MSKHDDEHASSSTLQPMVIIFGLILVVAVVVGMLMATPAAEDAAPPAAQVADVAENIAPVAAVEVAAASDVQVAKSGAEVVKAGCAMCHAAGLMSAPIIGDKAQWEPRIAQGYDMLVSNAINGIRTMPAKGGNPALTDAEVAAAVVEMANQSGASFEVPAPAEAAPAS